MFKENIASGLILTNEQGDTRHLVSDFIEAKVDGDKILYGEEIQKVCDYMEEVASNLGGPEEKWNLYMAYAGRCWVLESDNGLASLSYIDYPTKSDWAVVGVEVL